MTSYRTPQARYGNAPENQQKQDDTGKKIDPIYNGAINLGSIMDGIYNFKPDKEDTYGQALKHAFGFNTLSNFMDQQGAIAMGHASAGIAKDMIGFTSAVEQQQNVNMANHKFNLSNQYNENTYRLKNQFQNQEFNRDIGRLQATGEQARLTETNRLRVGGDEQRMTDENKLRVAGDETRITATHNDKIEAGKEKRESDRVMKMTRRI